MAISIQELTAVVSARITDFSAKMSAAGNQAASFGAKFATVANGVSASAAIATTAIAGIATAATAAAINVIEASEEQRRAVARLQAAFDATGHQAGVTVKQVAAFADARQHVTNFGDETTIQAAAILAAFRAVQGEGFTRTLSLAQDVAEFFEKDLSTATRSLGIALASPAEGFRALRSVGVVFNEQEKENIKTLVESNRVMEARAFILDAVASRVGGAAERAASPLVIMRNLIGEVAEDIGTSITPAFKEFSESLLDLVQNNRQQIVELAKSFFEFGLSLAKVVTEHPRLASFFALFAAGHLVGINRGVIDLARGFVSMGGSVASMVKAGLEGASTIEKIGTAANLAKAGLVALAIAGIAALAVAIYRAMPSIRAWNQEVARGQELNAKIDAEQRRRNDAVIEQAQSIQDQASRQQFLNSQLEMAQKNLVGLEASLAGAKKQVAEWDGSFGEFSGNKVLEDLKNSVVETTAALERQKEFIQQLKDEVASSQAVGSAAAQFPSAAPEAAASPAAAEAAAAAVPQAVQEQVSSPVTAVLPDLFRFGESLNELKGVLPTSQLDEFFFAAMNLRGELESGSITTEQFSADLDDLSSAVAKSAEAARAEVEAAKQKALIAGDFKGAGLDFNKAVQEQAASIQMQEFNRLVNEAARSLLGLDNAAAQVDETFTTVDQNFEQFGNQMSEFSDNMQGFGQNVQANAAQVSGALNSLGQFLNSRAGMIASIQNQISSLQQFLSLSDLDYQKRAAILAQIDALAAQLQALLREPPPPLSPWHGDPNFVDPGLDDGKNRNPNVRTRTLNDVHIHSIFPPSAADKRALMDAIIDELQRTGYAL